MFKKIKQFICKIFHIKACQCTDEPVVLEETPAEESTVDHCDSHLRFRKNCPNCLRVVALI